MSNFHALTDVVFPALLLSHVQPVVGLVVVLVRELGGQFGEPPGRLLHTSLQRFRGWGADLRQLSQDVAPDESGDVVVALLVREQPIPVGTQLQLAVTLPGREQPVNAIAEVVSNDQFEMIDRTDRRRSVEVGTRCLEIAPVDQEALTQFIASRLRPAAV